MKTINNANAHTYTAALPHAPWPLPPGGMLRGCSRGEDGEPLPREAADTPVPAHGRGAGGSTGHRRPPQPLPSGCPGELRLYSPGKAIRPPRGTFTEWGLEEGPRRRRRVREEPPDPRDRARRRRRGRLTPGVSGRDPPRRRGGAGRGSSAAGPGNATRSSRRSLPEPRRRLAC